MGDPPAPNGLSADRDADSSRGARTGRVSSEVEQRFCKPLVGGSNPSPGTGRFPGRADCVRLAALQYPWRKRMPQGTVKWFNPTKGYGFIQPQEGGKDVFVHISAVERAGLTTLSEGQTIQYELVENRGRTSAENLKVK